MAMHECGVQTTHWSILRRNRRYIFRCFSCGSAGTERSDIKDAISELLRHQHATARGRRVHA